MTNLKAKIGHPHDASKHLQENYNKQTQLNTYIYEYFLHNSMFQCAQSILKADSDVRVQRHSPGSDRHDKGLRLKNALRNKTIDSRLDSTHSNLLPAPNVPNLSPDSCFLYEWFCLFWAMFNAQKNENRRIEACQYACHIQQQNWPKWNVSWPQTQISLPLLQAPGSATHNAFYNSGEVGEGNTDHNWSVQWQNDSSENQIPETSPRGVQGTLQERSRLPPVQPADANDSVKPRSTVSPLSQTSKPALPTPQLSKAVREKIPFPKGTILKRRTTNVKDEMMTCKVPKLNAGSTATRPANAAPSPVPHINPVGIRKDAPNSSLLHAVPTGQPAVALPLTPASMAANPPFDLVQSATLNIENCNMTDFASFPTFEDKIGEFDLGAFLESSVEDTDPVI
ncbi:hypothetical protein FOFC_21310 [Fusarium oxysporum]|nr:hypothetical protein FOFC_21310 [Fusarium oxysporum]